MSNVRIPGRFVFAILCAPLLMGGACEKKANKPNDTGAIAALDQAAARSGSAGTASAGGSDTTPLPGVDLGKLDADKTQLFYKLIGSLKSPCGKAHSLRTSFSSDASCKRAPFAVRYVLSLLEDEATETAAREEYAKKYEKTSQPVTFDTSKAPHAGADDARIKLVEFYDYECPHCQLFKPAMEQILSDKNGQISVYFMMYPIESKHPESRSAAQAALAANQQGKFKEMHDKLFEVTPRHSHDDVVGYAKELGLDLPRFEKAYAEASGQVTSDLKQAENAGVDSTPTLFFNDRKYEGPMHPKYIEMWIDEEIAVNR
ncbi:MAG TPA: thioredoxin domain-containing protein [Kofleriaceae bacterium]|nr:thioredoxin domain-containing protein [Kofleriaceae bacterium]